MHPQMSYKMAVLNECLIIHHTRIWTVTNMNALKVYNMILSPESFITDITNLRALTSMYALM